MYYLISNKLSLFYKYSKNIESIKNKPHLKVTLAMETNYGCGILWKIQGPSIQTRTQTRISSIFFLLLEKRQKNWDSNMHVVDCLCQCKECLWIDLKCVYTCPKVPYSRILGVYSCTKQLYILLKKNHNPLERTFAGRLTHL